MGEKERQQGWNPMNTIPTYVTHSTAFSLRCLSKPVVEDAYDLS